MNTPINRGSMARLLAVLALSSLIFTRASAQTFTADNPLNTARWSHTATLLTNGLVLIAGGTIQNEFPNNQSRATNSCELYDPATGIFNLTDSLPEATAGHVAVLLTNGLVLVAGGAGDFGGTTANAVLYYPASGSWTNTGLMNQGRTAFAAALLRDGRVLVVGGFSDENGEESSVEIYDPVSGTWGTVAPLGYATDSLTATVLADGKVLVAGGSDGGGGGLTNASIFNPLNQTWTPTGPLKTARAGQAAVLLPDGQVLVAGGSVDNSAELYNPATGQWNYTGDLNEGRSYPSMTLLPNGQVLAIGGSPDQTSTEVYDPGTEIWTSDATLNVGRVFHAATLLDHGQVLVTGGDSGVIGYYNGPAIADVETYNQISKIYYALDATNLDWTTGGGANWFLETTNTHDGVSAAQSGTIGDDDQSWIQTTVTGPGDLTFWWQVSSETNADTLEFDIDDAPQDQITGVRDWAQATYSIPPGEHELKWIYFKDANGSAGADAGFLDEVSFVPLIPPPSLATSVLPSSGSAPLTVQFISSGVDGDGNAVTNWSWSFGDGSGSTNQNPIHVYSSVGLFNPSLFAQSTFGAAPLDIAGLGPISVTNRPFGFATVILPQLSIQKVGDQTVLSVFNRLPGSLVESTPNFLFPAPWPQVIPFADSQTSMILQTTNVMRYFRLRAPTNFDIASVAPALNETTFSDIASATEFIYDGTNAIQTGVASGTIEPARAAVLRGRVLQRDGSPLSGVRVTVLDHSEFGQTFTRADGYFDLAVNGGFELRLSFEKFGYLPAQRSLSVTMQNYHSLPDAVLVPVDPVVTVVTLGDASPGAIARGSMQTDKDGSRTATLVMPSGLHADIVMPDGSTQPAGTLHIRATEFTVGTNGPAAMPAALPPTSGYTYAVELSADEAVAVGANTVTFDQDIPFYVENFLGFAVGIRVPSAYYDRLKAAWVPIPDGKVIKITQVANNLAEVDTDGDGNSDADHGASIGITTEERGRLATLYTAGQSLWRVPVRHFTAFDHNYSIIPGPGSTPPGQPAPEPARPKLENPGDDDGYGTIEVENQVLTEQVPVAGTPFSLEYSSGEATDDPAAYQLLVHLSGTNVPATLKGIRLTLYVAGQTFVQNFPPNPNQDYVFTWNGLDVYGRKLPGRQPVDGRIDYTYAAFYQFPGRIFTSWGVTSAQPMPVPSRFDIDLSQTFSVKLGALSRKGLGLGGWDLNAHHMYDLGARTLYLGYGGQRHAESVSFIVKRVAGVLQQFAPLGNEGPAVNAKLSYPYATAFGPDGSMYIVDGGNYLVRRVTPDGIIHAFAGVGSDFSYGDNGPAVTAGLDFVQDVAVGPDGSVYISDYGNGQPRVRRVDASGIIRTVAGGNPATGDNGPNGDGGPATLAGLPNLDHIAVASDGTLYIDEGGFSYANKIRRVGPDGTISTFAGQGAPGFSGDGGPAPDAKLGGRLNMAIGPDGSVYIADSFNYRIRRVTPDGIINTVIGGGTLPVGAEGVQATNLSLTVLGGIDVDHDGTVYFSCTGTNLGFAIIYRVTADGIAHLHGGENHAYGFGNLTADNIPSRQAQFDAWDLTVGPDGALYVCDLENYGYHQIRRIAPPMPAFDGDPIFIPSEDGSQVYVFDGNGRHMSTKNALTGATLLEFHYDAAGRLTSVQDGNGLVTTIQHDASGNPTEILAPFGQHTTLAPDVNGFLASVSNPAGEATLLGYSGSGLLSSVTGPKGDLYTFGYDALGRLQSAADLAGGSTILTYSDRINGYEVLETSALGRVSHHLVETLTNGVQRRLTTYADGTQKELLIGNNDGVRTTTLSSGTVVSSMEGPDPRFGMQVPILNLVTVSTPGGLTNTLRTDRVVNLLNPDDVFSVSSITDRAIINGRTNSVNYFSSNRTFIATSPEGRSSTNQIDFLGRTIFSQAPGMNPVTFAYDSLGRGTNTVVGSGLAARSARTSYDSGGRLQSSVDTLGQEFDFDYDAVGRLTQQHLPGGRVVQFGYDLNGRTASITPPGRPAHQFGNDIVNQLASYTPPTLNGITNRVIYQYNADRDQTNYLRSDGQPVSFAFDSGGRVSQASYPNSETLNSSYDPVTGHLTNVSSSDGNSISFARDGALLTNIIWSGDVTGRVSFVYDQEYRIATQQVNGSVPVQFAYNGDGLVTNVGALRLGYHPENALLSGTALNAVADTRAHDAFGELTNYTATFSNLLVYGYALQFDALGRITNKTETIGGGTINYSYAYDVAGRLSEVRAGGAAVADYAYDQNGNRLARTNGSVTATYVYDNRDQLRQRTVGAEFSQFDYTPDGELRTQTVASAATTFTYDARGSLRQLVKPDSTQIVYVVDAAGRRIGKRINGTLVKGFLYQDALNPIAELDGNNNVVSRFVFGARMNVPEYMIRGGVTYRILCDHLGSVRLVVNSTNGAVAQRLDYDEFGAVLADTNPGFQPFGFAGGIYDADTGLVRFGLRDYDASVGRWTKRDPIGFEGGDTALFNYVANDPLNAIDSTGTGPYWREVRARAIAGDARAMASFRNHLRTLQNIDTGVGDDGLASAEAYGKAVRVSQAGILTLSAVSGFSAMAGAATFFGDAALAGTTLSGTQVASGVVGFANGGVALAGNAANAAMNLSTPLDKPVPSAPTSIPQAVLPESLAPLGDAALGKATPEAGGPAWAKTASKIDDGVTKATTAYKTVTGEK